MDVYTHGLRCQIVPADRDDGGRLEYDIFGAPYSDNVVTSAATFATTEEARAALETHAAEVAVRIAAAPEEFATITRLIEDAGYSVRPLPGYLHMAIRAARGEYEANVWFDPFSGWRAHDPDMQVALRRMARGNLAAEATAPDERGGRAT